MKKTIYKAFSILMVSSMILVLPNTVNNIANAESADNQGITIKGIVADSRNTLPLKDVYIKQKNTLNTVLTDENGNFSIVLEKGAARTLSISKEGYEKQELNITTQQNTYRVILSPITKFDNQNLPAPHSDAADLFNYSNRPISSNFSALYQVRFEGLRVPTLDDKSYITSSGWSINELAANGQIRFNNWLAGIKVFRGRYPLNIDNFQFNPAYYLDTTQFQATGGTIFRLSDKMDLYTGLSYLLHFSTPDNRGGSDNKPIPYSNSYQDFPRTSQGPGITGNLGYLWNDKIVLNAGATLYPVVFSTFDSLNKSNFGYHGMFEFGGGIKVETLPGIYVAANYTNQFFFGFSNFLDDLNLISVGVSLDPFKMANIALNTSTTSNDQTLLEK